MSVLRTFGGVLLNRFSGKLAKNNHGFFNDRRRLNQLFQVSSYFGARNNNVYLSTDATKKKEKTDSLLAMDPNRFAGHLQKLGIKRCFVVWDFEEGKVKVSHPELEELAQFCAADKVNYDEHEGVFMEVGRRTGVLMGAFVWRTYRGQACGGIRLWNYPGMDRYLTDGLRLAQGMGVKSALAGLWAGGGKGVVQEPMHNKHRDPSFRQNMFFDYGDFLSSLNGCYVSAEDVGLNVNDLNNVMQRTRYTTCISEELGGSGNPSILTGKGVVCAMEAALDFLSMGTLKEKTVAIQGAGNVALVIIETLLEKGVKYIYVTECHQNRVDDMKRILADKANGRLEIQKVPIDDTSIMSYNCDILSPCALGGILNEDTIPQISAPIVCGAANNQLGCPEDNQLLKERGITYIVDYVANRMGIVNCANETYGRLPDDPAITRHLGRDWENSVFKITKEILQKAEQEDVTPVEAADVLADKASRELHPIWPHRSQQIIKALVDGGWHRGNNIYGSLS
ncbi:leucine dehydrogenase-like [Branchiostoma floridae x Branchiostoma belcheri]